MILELVLCVLQSHISMLFTFIIKYFFNALYDKYVNLHFKVAHDIEISSSFSPLYILFFLTSEY